MAASLNKTLHLGNLTRDPELKFTPQGKAVCNFSIAVNESFKGADGEMKKQVYFFNIVVWGKSAENCGKYLSKGKQVLVEGKLVTRSYETQDKQKRTVTEIVAENVQFLGSADSPRHSEPADRGDAGPALDEYPQDAPPLPGSGDSEVPF